jgi:formamidopyrimidine-DNA glycosylase
VPELPEVEVLVRHLRPLLQDKIIHAVQVRRERVLGRTSARQLGRALRDARFLRLSRRGKFLLFTLCKGVEANTVLLVGHLGMTGRMYLLAADAPLPKHAAVVLDLGAEKFVFEDTRYFGRFSLDTRGIETLGPEPLSAEFTAEVFAKALKSSRQAIKIKLLDQSLVAGVGNIYASEALFRAGISPRLAARKLRNEQVLGLWRAIREVLTEAIDCGSTVPLNHTGAGERDGFFYFGRASGTNNYYHERLQVYDRWREPCFVCGTAIRRRVQAARSTFYCPHCQSSRRFV